ncbi:nuclear transport factor 2 family protein [Arenimonas terrae]|uniref:Nuclear transport factor 2 family protein n=1 Tax=Arenimonas terrae TaxID=2546226 RepID=A0A5C4RPW7_9GAMM|nr:nuclear transport factor 2 family protein [Arenimonas terrae]TNJ33266.1 nuclear transport factor 2 family protein [Arenimonas terrae]
MNSIGLIAPLLVVTGLLAEASDTVDAPTEALAEVQLRALTQKMADARRLGDSRFFRELVAPDFLQTTDDGRWLDRDAFLVRTAEESRHRGLSYNDIRVRVFGPVALLHSTARITSATGEVENVRNSEVYVWSGSRWRLVSTQSTSILPGVGLALQTALATPDSPWEGAWHHDDDPAALRELNESYVQAFRDADVAWYGAHLSPDYLVVNGDGSFYDRAVALTDFAKPTYATQISAFPVDKVNIRRFNDVALVHAENAYLLKDGRSGVNRYTDVWVRRDGRWTCVAAHITVHRPAA